MSFIQQVTSIIYEVPKETLRVSTVLTHSLLDHTRGMVAVRRRQSSTYAHRWQVCTPCKVASLVIAVDGWYDHDGKGSICNHSLGYIV